jgi:hypothetical protein
MFEDFRFNIADGLSKYFQLFVHTILVFVAKLIIVCVMYQLQAPILPVRLVYSLKFRKQIV